MTSLLQKLISCQQLTTELSERSSIKEGLKDRITTLEAEVHQSKLELEKSHIREKELRRLNLTLAEERDITKGFDNNITATSKHIFSINVNHKPE